MGGGAEVSTDRLQLRRNHQHLGLLLHDHKEFSKNQNVTNNCNNSVCSNGAVARRPWKHQYAEKRFQLFGPEKASNAKNEVNLY